MNRQTCHLVDKHQSHLGSKHKHCSLVDFDKGLLRGMDDVLRVILMSWDLLSKIESGGGGNGLEIKWIYICQLFCRRAQTIHNFLIIVSRKIMLVSIYMFSESRNLFRN